MRKRSFFICLNVIYISVYRGIDRFTTSTCLPVSSVTGQHFAFTSVVFQNRARWIVHDFLLCGSGVSLGSWTTPPPSLTSLTPYLSPLKCIPHPPCARKQPNSKRKKKPLVTSGPETPTRCNTRVRTAPAAPIRTRRGCGGLLLLGGASAALTQASWFRARRGLEGFWGDATWTERGVYGCYLTPRSKLLRRNEDRCRNGLRCAWLGRLHVGTKNRLP